MTERFAQLCQNLRLALVEIAKEQGHPKGKPLADWIDKILEDDGPVLGIIESFDSSSWMTGKMTGKYDGCVDGWTYARELVLKAAGDAFVAGYDDKAGILRKLATDMLSSIEKAKIEAAAQRKERGK